MIGKSGNKLEAAQVVLALGNFPPGEAAQQEKGEWFTNDPYAAEVHAKLSRAE